MDKAQRTIYGSFVWERKEEDVSEKGRKRSKSPRAKQSLGRWLFLLSILMQTWFCDDAAVGRLEPKEKAEVLDIIIVSYVVECTFVDLEGKKLSGGAEGKAPEKVQAVKRSRPD